MKAISFDGPRRSIVLAGGGVRLAYQAGVLQALQQAGLHFNHIDGTSGGIFNAGMLASGLSPDEMADNWRSLNLKYFMSALPVKSYFRPFRLTGMGDADGIRKGVFPSLGINISKIRNNKDFVTTFNVCNFSDKAIESVPGEAISEDLMVAGVSLPIFMPSVWINDAWYTDAVWIKDANLLEAVRRGAEEIWLVWVIGNTRAYYPGSFIQYVHMIEMSANGGLLEEFRQIDSINEKILKGDSPFGQKKPIRLHVIKPRFPLPLDPDLFLKKIDTHTLINMGYSDAMEYLQSGTGVTFDGFATKMSDPGVSLNFQTLFSGEMKISEKTSQVMLRMAFNLRDLGNQVLLFVNASLFIKSLDREFSTFNNKAEIRKNQKSSQIVVYADFQNEKGKFRLRCEIPLGSYVDWRLGLEFRKARIQLLKEQDTEALEIANGMLVQNTGDRVRYLFRCSLYSPEGRHKRQTKHKMMKWMYLNDTLRNDTNRSNK
jgi:predicted acylesterase/phospholipase RssA